MVVIQNRDDTTLPVDRVNSVPPQKGSVMHIAYTRSPRRGDTDHVLERLATRLAARGLRIVGTVQINTKQAESDRCDMDVKVLPAGPVIRISQDLGPEARGCRLDAVALETAVGLTESRLDDGVHALIVNKFGKHEAEGRGFRSTIVEALGRGLPVLVGLNGLNQDSFHAFSGGEALELPPEVDALESWLCTAIEGQPVTAGQDQ